MSLGRAKLLALQALVAVVAIGIWHVGSSVPIAGTYFLPKFFFSTPADVGLRVWTLFADGTAKIVNCKEAIEIGRLLSISDPCFGKTVWQHLLITLTEGVLAFVIGAVAGIALGFWLARNALLSAIFDPYIKMLNALPRVVLAPIFMLWLGLGIWSKVALGVTLVFFIVFFNVYQGVKEVSPTILANARMLGHERAPAVPARLLALGAVLGVLLAAHLGRVRHHRRGGGRIPGLGGGPRLPDPAGRGHLRHDGRVCRHGDPRRIRAHHRLAGDAGGAAPAGVAAAGGRGAGVSLGILCRRLHRQRGEASGICAPNNAGFPLQPCLSASGTFVHPSIGRIP